MQLVITGPNGASSTVTLGDKPLTLGRSGNNDLPYPEDPALSRQHFAIEKVGDGWSIKDCGSRNGTILNDVPVTGATLLKPGDRILVGHLTIDIDPDAVTPSPRLGARGATISTTLDEVLGAHGLHIQTTQFGVPSLSSTARGSNRVVSALIRAGQELAGHRPLNELFEVILDLALSAVDARRGVILTAEDNGLSARASRGEGFSLSTAVRSEVLRKRTSLIISDAQFDAALREQKSIVAQSIRSIMAVPLQTHDRVIGLIYVDNGSVLHPFSREDLDLLTVMANVAAIRIEHARLALVEQQERVMQMELDQACEIQRSLLPEKSPEYNGWEIDGYNLACRAVGGDYYDFLPYHDGRLALIVADVCGKGMPAALMMSSLQARVQILAESNPDPSTAVTTLNRNLAGKFPLGRFITAFFAVLDPATGAFEFANAGHNYPLVVRSNGTVEELRGSDLVLGLMPGITYKLNRTSLNKGDLLVMFSDGVTEAAQPSGEQLGEGRLSEFLLQNPELPCSELVPKLVDYVRSWSGATAFADDFTVVMLRSKP
jgi:serine phosphatase RsbU (regulator of sigma subunit)